jgi:glycosyltransferase involved in cell wall biosynthesis
VKQIICLSNEPWSSSPGRTQQLISRLKDTQVLFFSPAAQTEGHKCPFCGDDKGRKVRANVTVYPLPQTRHPVDERHHYFFHAVQRKLSRFIGEKAARHRFTSPLLWTTHPRQVHLLDLLDYDSLVYDCDRTWDDLSPAWEGSLAHAADVVFAASPQLRERLSPCSGNIALLPNGVNYPLFSGDAAAPRDPLPRVRGPILGWAGTISPALDLSPLLFAAQTRPDWVFLLLGRQEDNPWLPYLRHLPNVLLPGSCSLDQVPDWLYRCDVLLDFLRRDQPYSDAVPTRLYEYLSTGKPIVTMLWPDQVELFPDVVYAAHTQEEFVTLCAHALAEDPSFVSQRRRAYGRNAAWPLRAGEVSRILRTAGLL